MDFADSWNQTTGGGSREIHGFCRPLGLQGKMKAAEVSRWVVDIMPIPWI